MALDLSDIQQFVEEELMVDTCRITRDAEFTADETWDPVTMTYSGGDDDEVVYEGQCWVSLQTSITVEETQGGANVQEGWYYLNIPSGSPHVQDKDFVEVTGVGEFSNPDLLGETFIVQNDEVGTYKVKMRIRMRRVIRTRTS